ncbi:hypothetical protein CR513_13366, partial [Mucuna pruriens]
MGWCIELPQHTIPRQMTKLKYSIGKSRKHCKRWSIPTERIGVDSLRMLYGHRTAYQTFVGDLSLPDCFRILSLLGSQAMQPGLQPSRKTKKALATRSGRSLLGSIREFLHLQAKGKLRSRWDGPFVITNVFPYGVVKLKDENTNNTF